MDLWLNDLHPHSVLTLRAPGLCRGQVSTGLTVIVPGQGFPERPGLCVGSVMGESLAGSARCSVVACASAACSLTPASSRVALVPLGS